MSRHGDQFSHLLRLLTSSKTALAGVLISTLAGRLSVKSTPAAATGLALLSMVKVSVLTSPATIGFGANALAKPGGGTSTVSSSVAELLDGTGSGLAEVTVAVLETVPVVPEAMEQSTV